MTYEENTKRIFDAELKQAYWTLDDLAEHAKAIRHPAVDDPTHEAWSTVADGVARDIEGGAE